MPFQFYADAALTTPLTNAHPQHGPDAVLVRPRAELGQADAGVGGGLGLGEVVLAGEGGCGGVGHVSPAGGGVVSSGCG